MKRVQESDATTDLSKRQLEKLKHREGALRTIIQKIVEQHALGELAKVTFADLYSKYLAEQETLLAEISKIEAENAAANDEEENAKQFVERVRKYTVVEELSREMLFDTIDVIVVHEATGSRHRWQPREQVIEIHYKFIGQLPEGVGV